MPMSETGGNKVMNINIKEYARAIHEIGLNYRDIYDVAGVSSDKKILKKLHSLNLILLKALGMDESSTIYNSSESKCNYDLSGDYFGDLEDEFKREIITDELNELFIGFYSDFRLDDSVIDKFLSKLEILLKSNDLVKKTVAKEKILNTHKDIVINDSKNTNKINENKSVDKNKERVQKKPRLVLSSKQHIGNLVGFSKDRRHLDLREGDKLVLLRETGNMWDKNAIKVQLDIYNVIGYVSKDLQDALAPLMDKGKKFSCEILEIVKDSATINAIKLLVKEDA